MRMNKMSKLTFKEIIDIFLDRFNLVKKNRELQDKVKSLEFNESYYRGLNSELRHKNIMLEEEIKKIKEIKNESDYAIFIKVSMQMNGVDNAKINI
jgi:hypothetical protein